MFRTTLPFVSLSVALLACGARSDVGDGEDSGPGADGSRPRPDAAGRADAGRRDAGGGACDGPTWRLVEVPADSVLPLGPTRPLNTERTARFVVTHELQACDVRATPSFAETFEGESLIITPRVWRPVGIDCPPFSEPIQRIVSYRFSRTGVWTVVSGGPVGGPPVMVEVLPPPPRPCAMISDCDMDCDCPAGQQCLDGYGVAGPFTSCATACELDRDCGGDGTCESPDDGLEFACRPFGPECRGDHPCPEGFRCEEDGICDPTFSLGSVTRVECRCDADCAAPLHCVDGGFGGRPPSCEILCPTGGPWCSRGHRCGPAVEDVAGSATADSVCIWDGE